MRNAVCCAVAVTLSALAGCASTPAGSMSQKELAGVRTALDGVAAGQPRDRVLESLKPSNVVKLGTASVEGVAVEEWKVEAFHDEKDQGRDLVVRFLYFVDGKLADISDVRVPFREKPELVRSWAKRG